MTSKNHRILFLSDAHLGADRPEVEARKRRLLFAFLDYVEDLGAGYMVS